MATYEMVMVSVVHLGDKAYFFAGNILFFKTMLNLAFFLSESQTSEFSSTMNI